MPGRCDPWPGKVKASMWWRDPLRARRRRDGLVNLQGYAQLARSGSYRPVGAASLATLARMAQQADAADSKSAARKGVRVRIPLRAPTELALSAFRHVCPRAAGRKRA